MSKKQRKFYVVWRGRKPGIYETWADCTSQVTGFAGAKYKSFLTRAEAEFAYRGSSRDFIGKSSARGSGPANSSSIGSPIQKSISVDAACDGAPGMLEYRGVETDTGKVIFSMGPFEQGTNNVGEFLAIVHAAVLLKKSASSRPIYSDSRTALSWVRKKHANTKLKSTAQNSILFELIEKAEAWLRDNDLENRVLKWETRAWGEIAADYGRK